MPKRCSFVLDDSSVPIISINEEDEEKTNLLLNIIQWLKNAAYNLKKSNLSSQGTVFMINLMAVLCKDEQLFLQISFERILDALMYSIKQCLRSPVENHEIFSSCIKLFSSFLNHKSGMQWIITSNAVTFLRSLRHQRTSMDSSLYRESHQFVAKLLQTCTSCNKLLLLSTVKNLLVPLNNFLVDTNITKAELKVLKQNIYFLVGVIEELLEQCSLSANFDIYSILMEKFNFEVIVRKMLAKVKDEQLVFSLNNILFILTFFELGKEVRGSCQDKVREAVWNFGLSLIEAAEMSKIKNVLKLCYLSHTYFAYSNRNGPMSSDTFENQILLLQFMPVLCSCISFGDIQSNGDIEEEEEIRQHLVTNFLKVLYPTTVRIYMSWKKHLNQNSLLDATEALKYILETRKYLSRDAANLATRMLIYVLRDLNDIKRISPEKLPASTEAYVELLLEVLIAYVEEFHLTGSDSIEAVSLLEIAFDFLCLNPNSLMVSIFFFHLCSGILAYNLPLLDDNYLLRVGVFELTKIDSTKPIATFIVH